MIGKNLSSRWDSDFFRVGVISTFFVKINGCCKILCNLSVTLVKSQLVCLPPVGILNLVMFI